MLRAPLRVSQKFREAVKLHPTKKQYQIAYEAGLDSSVLSRILHGYEKLVQEDPRVIRLGKIVGLKPSQVFAMNKHKR